MISFRKCLPMIVTVMFASPAFAHGETKPGPHGGYIRMPGGFHTEVVPIGTDQLKIFLVDLSFNSPTTEKSKVDVTLVDAAISTPIVCKADGESFACKLPAGRSLDKGMLEVTANRQGAYGLKVRYNLPLSFSDPNQDQGMSKN